MTAFLRGRVATQFEHQIVVVYCREEALASPGTKLTQFLRGLAQVPILIRDDALVISDNTDIYGTVADVVARAEGEPVVNANQSIESRVG